MTCCAQTAEIARRTAKAVREDIALDPLLHWRWAAKYYWPKLRRRRPVAIIENSLHRRTYQCLACGSELTLKSHHRQTGSQIEYMKNFVAHHNALRCVRKHT